MLLIEGKDYYITRRARHSRRNRIFPGSIFIDTSKYTRQKYSNKTKKRIFPYYITLWLYARYTYIRRVWRVLNILLRYMVYGYVYLRRDYNMQYRLTMMKTTILHVKNIYTIRVVITTWKQNTIIYYCMEYYIIIFRNNIPRINVEHKIYNVYL